MKESCNAELNFCLWLATESAAIELFPGWSGSQKIPGIPTREFRPLESSVDSSATDRLGVKLVLEVYYDLEIPNCFTFTLSVSHDSFRLRKRHSEYYKNGKFTLQSATYAMGAQNG